MKAVPTKLAIVRTPRTPPHHSSTRRRGSGGPGTGPPSNEDARRWKRRAAFLHFTRDALDELVVVGGRDDRVHPGCQLYHLRGAHAARGDRRRPDAEARRVERLSGIERN